MLTYSQEDIPFEKTPPTYGPELPEWWQLALAGYDVACHVPTKWIGERNLWRPERPPQLDPDWFLVAVGFVEMLLHEFDDGQLYWEHHNASFWARRPPHIEGPTAQTFTEVKRWATDEPIELEAASVRWKLTVYWGELSDEYP